MAKYTKYKLKVLYSDSALCDLPLDRNACDDGDLSLDRNVCDGRDTRLVRRVIFAVPFFNCINKGIDKPRITMMQETTAMEETEI